MKIGIITVLYFVLALYAVTGFLGDFGLGTCLAVLAGYLALRLAWCLGRNLLIRLHIRRIREENRESSWYRLEDIVQIEIVKSYCVNRCWAGAVRSTLSNNFIRTVSVFLSPSQMCVSLSLLTEDGALPDNYFFFILIKFLNMNYKNSWTWLVISRSNKGARWGLVLTPGGRNTNQNNEVIPPLFLRFIISIS